LNAGTLIGLAALLIIGGCSGANYGGKRHSRDVRQAFETYHVYPDHRYDYLNQANNPHEGLFMRNMNTKIVLITEAKAFQPGTIAGPAKPATAGARFSRP
jgi:hypothetical protein